MKTYYIFLIFCTIFIGSCSNINSTDFTSEYSFTKGIEGPATDNAGNIYAVNFEREGTIGKVSPKGEASLFVTLPNGSIGNGIQYSEKQQLLYVADYTNHNILAVSLSDKSVSILHHNDSLNQPNDIALSKKGILYASDPNWEKSTGNLWRVTPNKGFELLEANMGTTNGITINPDGKILYVNESVQRNVWKYSIADNGNISNKTLFYKFPDYGLDGMRCDPKGNLYICRYEKGTVVVLSPQGIILKEFKLKGKKPSNMAFSPDYKRIYITMADRGNLEVIEK